MLHLHVTVVTLFLLFLLFKTVLLLIGKKAFLQKLRNKTKIVEIILGILIIVTGGYLFFITGNTQTYLIVKIILVFIAIPLGIVGLKRENTALTVLSLLLFIYIYGVAETRSLTFKRDKFDLEKYSLDDDVAGQILDSNANAALQKGKVIYKVLCVECHGEDGKKSVFNAANLTQSTLSQEEKEAIIAHGKGVMKGFDRQLSEEEIELVAAYTETLKD